jgi:hypothetical protein
MPAKRDVIVNPFVSEFIYDVIINATLDQRRILNGKYAKVGRSKRKARAFSVTSTLEEKALMLAKLGVPFAWVFNLEKGKFQELKGSMKQMNTAQISDKMLNEKYFVITDKQFLFFANLMASNSHSETWLMNRDFLNAAYRLSEWKQNYSNIKLSEAKDALPAAREMAKIMMNTIMFSSYADSTFDINEAETAILLYFLSKEKEFIAEDELKLFFNGIYRNFKLVRAINTLLKAKYIEKGEGEWAKQYRITGWGVDIALRFEKKVFSLENY